MHSIKRHFLSVVVSTLTCLSLAGANECAPSTGAAAAVPRNQVSVSVKLFQGEGRSPVLADQKAEILVRDERGLVVFRTLTDEKGHATLPFRPSELRPGQEIAARVSFDSDRWVDASVAVQQDRQGYVLVFAPPALSFPELGIYIFAE